MIVPQHVANQLSLQVAEQKEITLADGAKRLVNYVGPLRVRFANRNAFVGAIVMGDGGSSGSHSDGGHGRPGSFAITLAYT